jgi:hypothetical protein
MHLCTVHARELGVPAAEDQFPERCERLALISSGGLGREVHLLLRADGFDVPAPP